MARTADRGVADPADDLASAAVRESCRREARGFFLVSHFLPKAKRTASYAVAAFFRMIDEAVGASPDGACDGSGAGGGACGVTPVTGGVSCHSPSSLDGRMQMFRDRLDEIYAGTIELPLPEFRSPAQHALHAVASTVRRYEVPRHLFVDYAEGRGTEQTVSRFATWRSLRRYCELTGGSAALAAGCVLGLTNSDAARHAVTLGVAMRLTAILRDLGRDVRRGRFFLPQEDLASFRCGERELSRGATGENFRELMRHQVERARALYREGAEGICWVAGDGARLAAAATAVMHAGVLRAIERRRYDVLAGQPAALTTAQKLRRLPAAWRLARREAGEPVPDVF